MVPKVSLGWSFKFWRVLMFLKRAVKIMINLSLLVILCSGQAAAAPNVGLDEDGVRTVTSETSGVTIRVSVSSAGVEGNSSSYFPSISANGWYVAFESVASNLVSGDTNGESDVFVRDTLTNTTTRVSVPSDGGEGNDRSELPSISADGRYVTFDSAASNLVSGDMNGSGDVFVRDTLTNITTRVSVSSDGGEGNAFSGYPSISADGRYVAFSSDSSNLVSGDTNGRPDVFMRDTLMNTTTRVSVSSAGVKGNSSSYSPSISADGRYVAFVSDASNLVSDDTNAEDDVFVRDTLMNTTTRVSVSSAGIEGNNISHSPSISADGRYVTFQSLASNLVSGDTNGNGDVFVRDTLTNITTRVSVSSDGVEGNYHSSVPSISADGRYVTFGSGASNLISGDTNGVWDTFVRDTVTNITMRVLANSTGVEGNNNSGSPSISADGRYVAFLSDANNLVGGDTNDSTDVFVHGMNIAPPSGKTPVVFVHGWKGASLPPGDCWSNHAEYEQPISEEDAKGYFQGVGDQLKTDSGSYDVFYAQLVSNSCYTPSLNDNVPYLITAIDKAKAVTGQSKVILIAHSMGGLVARAYIEGPRYRGDVETLFTFGSPHLGTPPAVLVYLANVPFLGRYCQDYQPAVCNFSTVGIVPFNWKYHHNEDVTYHVISGDAPFWSRSPFGMAADALIPGPDDGIVPTDSGRATLLGTFDRWTTDEVHGPGGDGFGPHTYFIRDGGISTSYTDCIKKVLVDGAANCGTVSVTSPSQEDLTPSLAQHTPFESGTLLSGQTATYNLPLEGGVTLFTAQWQNGTLAFTLIDPSGQPIDKDYATANPGIVTYTEDSNAATYYFPAAMTGIWQMKLQTISVPAEGASFSAFAAFDSSMTLSGTVDKNWYTPGTSATITAALSGSPSSATVTANVIRADGVSDALTFSPIGNGQYQATYVVPNVPGYAEVQFAVTGTTASSLPFEQSTNAVFQISPDTFTLNDTYVDTPVPYPGLSAYQFLDVAVGIDAVIDGKVGLSADLVDGSGNFVAHTLTIQDVTAGLQTVTLRFDGAEIFASRHNGPYTLTNILVTDENDSTLVTQQAESVYTTASYPYTDFDTVSPITTSVTRANPTPTKSTSVDFTVTFSEPVNGVDLADFNLNSPGISGTTITNVSGGPMIYTVAVLTGSGSGTLRLDISETATITDLVGNALTGLPFITGDSYSVRTTTFTDVPIDYWSWQYIERLYGAGITGGCSLSPMAYCPNVVVTRAQMAVFLLRGEHGATYTPPEATGTVFGDIPQLYWAAAWIEQLAAEGITGGCGSSNYCPEVPVTRAQMAVFLLRAEHGAAYAPPAMTGVFTDVPVGYWAGAWIEQLATEGITGGCGTDLYCPTTTVTRNQMAVFLVRTFNLP